MVRPRSQHRVHLRRLGRRRPIAATSTAACHPHEPVPELPQRLRVPDIDNCPMGWRLRLFLLPRRPAPPWRGLSAGDFERLALLDAGRNLCWVATQFRGQGQHKLIILDHH